MRWYAQQGARRVGAVRGAAHIPAALVRVPEPQPVPWNRKGVPVWLHASLGLPLALGELACLCRAGTVGKCRGRTKVPREEDAQRCSTQPPGGASGRHRAPCPTLGWPFSLTFSLGFPGSPNK